MTNEAAGEKRRADHLESDPAVRQIRRAEGELLADEPVVIAHAAAEINERRRIQPVGGFRAPQKIPLARDAELAGGIGFERGAEIDRIGAGEQARVAEVIPARKQAVERIECSIRPVAITSRPS